MPWPEATPPARAGDNGGPMRQEKEMAGVRPMVSLTLAALAALHSLAPTIKAQSSVLFERERQALVVEAARLQQTPSGLQQGVAAFDRQVEALNAKGREITTMPAAIGRNAALADYNRDKDDLQQRRDALLTDIRVAEYDRRVHE